MDRFVSASSTQDATNSLNEIVDGFKNKQWHADWVLDHEDMAEHLVWWLQNATLKGREIPCGEDGVRLVCELYQFLVQQSRKALEKPTPGALLESLLDVLDHPDHPNPIYVRVLALNILEDMSRRHKAVASNQWMEAPNGLHRLKDILATDVEANPLEEAVRGQALVVTKLLAKEAPLAKVFLFADVHCILLSICESSGGLTGGERTVIDSLQLVVELLRHADANMQDYVWQSRNVAPILHKLVNLTFGDAIVHPGKKYDTKQTESKSLGHDDDDENDGLDNLLGHGGSNSEVANEKKDKAAQESEQDILASLPHLLPSEVEVVQLAFKIIGLLLESESVRRTMWKKQFLLFSMIWDMAWLIPVLPPHAPTFALIPPSLQQEALSLIANKLNDPENMAHHHGLDRLMRLVATGGEIAKTLDDKLAISQAALAVLRHTLSGDVIHATLMRTLAPPPIPDDDENAKPPGPTEIHKLWGTVTENLPVEKSDQRTIFLSGAFGGLGLMLCDEQSKEIMSRVSPISFDHILESLFSEQEELIQCSMLRFLCEWIYQCPLVAHNLLSSTSSMHLAEMAATPSDHQSLVHLLLGLAMEYLNNEEDCGGWTRAGILHIITKIGISKYTNSLEGLKTTKNPKLPWVVADAEYKSWKDFCNKAVLIVRKRVVEELAGRSGEDDDGSDDDGVENAAADTSTSGKGTKPLRRLISQQARENEELRQQLEEAQAKVTSQENQINAWKRRIESNPTQLDTMLNEFQLKTARLEETIRMKEVEAEKFRSEKDATNKDLQEKLSQSEKEIERLRTKEQETRDDLERTEQEMQALSQAYSNLEIEYQRAQSSTSVVAPAGEASQQQGSHQAAGSGSLEVVTLRAENERLRTDAKAADDWMAMAVQKMNEMGAANIELQQQVTALTGQLNVAQTSTQRDVRSQEVLQREKEAFEAELQQTRSSLMTIKIELENERSKSAQLERYVEHSDAELSDLRGLRTLLDSERQRAAQLEEQVVASTAELADLRGLRKVLDSENQRTAQLEAMLQDYQTDGTRLEVLMHDLQSEQQKCLEVEKRLEDAEEQLSSTKMQLEESTRKLEHEKLLTAQLQNQLETSSVGVRNESHSGSEKVETLRMQYDKMLASKDQEIFSLTIALKETRENAHNLDDKSLSETLEQARREVESIQEKSQQDIYRLESVVRELKDRLGSGKGAYTFDDIQSRDREIQELREANEAAQEWMGKAVEHSQQNAAQIAKLTEEKAALEHQLNEEHRRSSFGVSDTSQSPKQELLDKTTELASLKQDFESLESELKGLKKEKEEQQGLLDDLGIAMEDVRIMQQKLVEAEEARSVLEAKLSGNALHQEAEDLRAINAELESRIGEFQKWTEIAQNKIAEIMAARDALQKELDTTRKENEDLAKQVQTSSGEDTNEFEILTTTLQEIKSSKNMLEAEIEQMRSRNESLTKDLREARTIAEKATQGIEAVESRNDGENTAKVEELLEDLRQKEEELLAANEALSKDEEVIQKWEGESVH
jgi:chromosome segregation ATPase